MTFITIINWIRLISRPGEKSTITTTMHNKWVILKINIWEFKEKRKINCQDICPAGWAKKISPGRPGGNIRIFFRPNYRASNLKFLATFEPPMGDFFKFHRSVLLFFLKFGSMYNIYIENIESNLGVEYNKVITCVAMCIWNIFLIFYLLSLIVFAI